MLAEASHTPRPTAQDALAFAVRSGTNEIEVACADPECGALLTLVASDAVVDRVGRFDEIEVCDLDGDTVVRCPGCLADVLPDTVVLRDRHGRVAAAYAEAA